MATIKDVARLAHVSIATVSNVLNSTAEVREETRERVWEAVRQLDYQPNAVARSLRGSHARILGFVLPFRRRRLSDPFFNPLVLGMADHASERQYHLLVSTCAPGQDELTTYDELARSSRVDGFIVADTRQDDERITLLQNRGFPFVAFGRGVSQSNFPFVDVDGRQGVREAVTHLLARGHRRVGLIELHPELVCAGHRRAGYDDALQLAGLEPDPALSVVGDLTETGGQHAAHQLLSLPQPPTAMMVCSDVMAIGAMNAAQARGLRVGQDVAIIGFDDIPLAAYLRPALTTVRQPIYEIGRRLIEMLIPLVQNRAPTETTVLLPPELVLRQSA